MIDFVPLKKKKQSQPPTLNPDTLSFISNAGLKLYGTHKNLNQIKETKKTKSN